MATNMQMLVLAVLLKRLGGEAKIGQSDIDEVAYGTVTEEWDAAWVAQKQMLMKVCTGNAPWQANSMEGMTA